MKNIRKPKENKDKKPVKKVAAALLVAGAMGCGSNDRVIVREYQVEDPNENCTVQMETCQTQTVNFRDDGNGHDINGVIFTFTGLGIAEDTAMFDVEACANIREYELPLNRLMSITERNAEFHIIVDNVQRTDEGLRVTTRITPICE